MRLRTLSIVLFFGLASVGLHTVMPPTILAADVVGAADRAENSADAYVTIHNDFVWTDQDGRRIFTRSGCLAQFDGVFYWYGGKSPYFHEQYCYTSTDLVHWTNQGVMMRFDVEVNRIDVLYNEKTKQYVMFMKYDGNGAHFAIATAEKPEGPFTFKSKMLIDGARIGDMSMFQDDDGKAYLCYISWAKGTNAQHGIYRMSDDYLTPEKRIFLWDVRGREAPHLFKRNGIYYYGTSKTAWIDSSGTNYYTAPNLEGPWSPAKPLSTPGSENSWDTQVDFIYPIRGDQGTVYLYAGDRWIKDEAKGRNGDYVWLPMEFVGDTPILNYRQDWELNLAAGTWREFDPARDLAAGKPVTASSEEGLNVANHVTTPKTYQDYASIYWESAPGDPQWISVDLGAPTEINRVILKWNKTAAKAFKIQTSIDGVGWQDVYMTSQGAPSGITDHSFPTTPARYVRMGATRRTAIPTTEPVLSTGYSLFQFMVLKD